MGDLRHRRSSGRRSRGDRLARAEDDVRPVVLVDADVLELVKRTEGWPVGLYLAALAVKNDGVRPGIAMPSPATTG